MAAALMNDYDQRLIRDLFVNNDMKAPKLELERKPCKFDDSYCKSLRSKYKDVCSQSLPCTEGQEYTRKELIDRLNSNQQCYEKRMKYNYLCCHSQIDPGHVTAILNKYNDEQECKLRLDTVEEKLQADRIKRKQIKLGLQQLSIAEKEEIQRLIDIQKQKRLAKIREERRKENEEKLRKENEEKERLRKENEERLRKANEEKERLRKANEEKRQNIIKAVEKGRQIQDLIKDKNIKEISLNNIRERVRGLMVQAVVKFQNLPELKTITLKQLINIDMIELKLLKDLSSHFFRRRRELIEIIEKLKALDSDQSSNIDLYESFSYDDAVNMFLSKGDKPDQLIFFKSYINFITTYQDPISALLRLREYVIEQDKVSPQYKKFYFGY